MGFNYAIDCLGLAIVVFLAVSEAGNKKTGYADQRIFRILLCVIAAVFLADIPAWLLDGQGFFGSKLILYILNTVYYIAQILYCYLWMLFAVIWNKKIVRIPMKIAVPLFIPCFLELAAILTNPLTEWIFSLTEYNVYERGLLYKYNLIPYFLYIFGAVAVSVVAYFKSSDVMRKRQHLLLVAYMILPICGTLMQAFIYGVSLLWPLTVLSLMMIYLNVQQQSIAENRIAAAEASQKAALAQNQLTEARISIMLSQIQPHFLYNALCVIQDLCHGKAPEAEEATIEFSRFLRGNLDSISAQNPVTFEQELNHTKNYLSLEKKRFNGRLNIEYRIDATNFLIPALTLQPIVENSVRYGICQRENGGTVCISSGEDECNYYITVRDNGVGFDINTTKKDGRSHIGIDNVRGRIMPVWI